MDKQLISSLLLEKHQAFISKIAELSDRDFERKPGKKWTSGQQLDHILKSVKQTDMAYGLPLFVLKGKFGVSNRPSATYDDLVKKYLKVLDNNRDYVLPERFAPKEIPIDGRQKALDKLQKLATKLSRRAQRFSEKELDTYIIPHPVMGKLTLREMLYFTIYHVQHHDKQILKNLNDHKNVTKS